MDKAFQVGRKHFSTTATKNIIQNVTIIGVGAMGSGIAQVSNTIPFVVPDMELIILSID